MKFIIQVDEHCTCVDHSYLYLYLDHATLKCYLNKYGSNSQNLKDMELVEVSAEVFHCQKCDLVAKGYIDNDEIEAIRKDALEKYYEQNGILRPYQIKGIRKEMNLTKKQLGAIIGYSHTTIEQWENFDYKYSKEISDKICDLIRNRRVYDEEDCAGF